MFAMLHPTGSTLPKMRRKLFEQIWHPTGLPAQERKTERIECIAAGVLRPHPTDNTNEEPKPSGLPKTSPQTQTTFTLPEMRRKLFEQIWHPLVPTRKK